MLYAPWHIKHMGVQSLLLYMEYVYHGWGAIWLFRESLNIDIFHVVYIINICSQNSYDLVLNIEKSL